MARRKITTIEEDEREQTALALESEQEETAPAAALDLSVSEKIAEIRNRGELDEVISRVYKVNATNSREFVGKIEDVIEEDYIAENYGPGKYMVIYNFKENGVRRTSSQVFIISGAYKATTTPPRIVGAPAPAGGFLGGLLDNLTAEKVAGIMAAIQGLKTLFAPPPPPIDMTELLKALATPRQNIGDAVLIKALEGVNRPPVAPAPSMLQQIKDIQAVKELLNDNAENAGGNDTMNMLVSAGLKMLPAILAQHGGNYQQAGAAVRDNPLISGMIEKDPELLGEFCAAVRDKYGAQAAKELAAGYGYDFSEPAPTQAPQIETITEQAAPQAAGV